MFGSPLLSLYTSLHFGKPLHPQNGLLCFLLSNKTSFLSHITQHLLETVGNIGSHHYHKMDNNAYSLPLVYHCHPQKKYGNHYQCCYTSKSTHNQFFCLVFFLAYNYSVGNKKPCLIHPNKFRAQIHHER